MDPVPARFSPRPSSVELGPVPVADLGPELRGIGTSGLLLEDLGEACAGGRGQRGWCFQPLVRVQPDCSAAVFSGLDYISQWTLRALAGVPFVSSGGLVPSFRARGGLGSIRL